MGGSTGLLRETFRDYLLEGVKGKYFLYDKVTIKIIDICDGRGSGAVHFQRQDGQRGSMNFESAYELKEATLKQIAYFRARESRLVAKTK